MKQGKELFSRKGKEGLASAPKRMPSKRKRACAALLTVVLAVGMMPSLALADDAVFDVATSEEVTSEPLSVLQPEAAEEVIVGAGTATSNQVPYNSYYNNAGSQILYTASEIGKTGTITALSFNVASASAMSQTSFKVYLGATDKESLTAADALGSDELTEVYSNDAQTIGSATGWETITLDTPFLYDGTKNLVVAVYRTASKYNSQLKYQSTSNVSGKTIYRGSDSNAAYGQIDGSGTYNTASSRPNIKLAIETCAHTTLTHHDAVAPACGSGNIEYWSCDNCGKTFADAAASQEIESVKAEHAYTGTVTFAPTCAEDGIMLYTCSVCNDEKEEVIPATKEHHFVDGFCTNLLRDGVTVCGAADEWDGTTLAEPAADEQGVYLIGDGAEFAWFMNAAKTDGYTGNARLTRNINLGELYSWYLPGGSSKDKGYQGTFDGDGHTITIALDAGSSNASLFNYIGSAGAVKNLTVAGSFTGASAASIAQYSYGEITNCVNRATIVAQGANKAYAAGITVYNNSGIIDQCANYATVSADATGSYASAYAGGITAYNQSITTVRNGVTSLHNCYNKGAVSAQKISTGTSNYGRAGGIVGYVSSSGNAYHTLENCLNVGNVSVANSVDSSSTAGLHEGGIIGAISYSAGNEANNQFTNCFYAQDCADAMYTCTTADKVPAVETNCGTASAQNIANAAWVNENLDQWFVDLLNLNAESHAVSFAVENATVAVDGVPATQVQAYHEGSLSFTVMPNEGYGLDRVSVGNEPLVAVDGVYTIESITEDITVTVTTHAHVWNDGTTTHEATCGEAGEKLFSCTVEGCAATRTEVIPATGEHVLSAVPQVDATCTEAGAAAYWKCDVCGTLFGDAEGQTIIDKPATIEALGHDFTDYRDNGDGTHSIVCHRCGEEKPGGWNLEDASDFVAGNTYMIVTGGYALSSDNGNSASMRKGVPYTAGENAVDDTLLWVWGADGSLKSVATGQYLNSGSSYFYLVMGDEPVSIWQCSDGKFYTTTSSGLTVYLYPLSNTSGDSIWGSTGAPEAGQLYSATFASARSEHEYNDENVCVDCGSILTHRTTSVSVSDDAFVNVQIEGTPCELYLVEATMSYVAQGYVPVVGELPLVLDGDTYKALVDKAAAQSIKDGTLVVSAKPGSAVNMGNIKGDVNMSGHMNIVDAQVTYDLSCARYGKGMLSMAGIIAADVNGDKAVNAADAFAIQYVLHYGWEA